MATTAQQQAFVSSNLAYATAAAQATGNSPSEVLGQWALETGWGTNYAGVNNPGNIMSNGVAVNYPTMSAGVGAYIQALQSEGVTGQALDPSQFANDLQSAGYAGNQSNYGQSVLSTIENIPASVNNSYGNTNLNNLSSTNPSIAQSGLSGIQATTPIGTNTGSGSACAFSLMDPIPWLGCNATNIVLVLLGLVVIVGGIFMIFSGSKNTAIQTAASMAEIG